MTDQHKNKFMFFVWINIWKQPVVINKYFASNFYP